ncbi:MULTISPECIES: NADH-quinone oxidoreductase subunit J [Cohaesibacter]|uniref:NADH-quinone oxidoreductase subunit J n=1 Tax=Cohaesibacter TaxID=655352 RepID=UPI000DE98220|nr:MULTISPECIES: NADH-quinone oxidoreductase subunit J [Cohaesibacter]TLP49007.1 NADH-quinone oxidoreductase subunit J [Cohaesibacter sp. CAU 1516]
MILQSFFFYLFSAVLLGSGLMVIGARNPVHSVLFLILAFFNAAALFVLLGAEFLAMLLIVVYVGAVAVLFLFIVMMLDIDFVELRAGFLSYMPIGLMVGLVLLAELIIAIGGWAISPDVVANLGEPIPDLAEMSNIEAIGSLLYTKYVYYFLSAAMILLVAMIGAIVLTLHHRKDVQRQDITRQVARTIENSIEIKKVESGKGI